MAKRRRLTTLVLLATVVLAGFVGLGARLAQLQIVQHDELSAQARRNVARQVFFEPKRGDILDSKGVLLATSTFAWRLCADPAALAHEAPVIARALAPVLDMTAEEVLLR